MAHMLEHIEKQADTRKRKDEFIAKAIAVLRAHQYCGECYPENGWPDVNKAIEAYKAITQ